MDYFTKSKTFSVQQCVGNKLYLHKKKSLLITNINNDLGGSVAEGADEPRCHFQHFQTSQKTPNEQKLEYSKK